MDNVSRWDDGQSSGEHPVRHMHLTPNPPDHRYHDSVLPTTEAFPEEPLNFSNTPGIITGHGAGWRVTHGSHNLSASRDELGHEDLSRDHASCRQLTPYTAHPAAVSESALGRYQIQLMQLEQYDQGRRAAARGECRTPFPPCENPIPLADWHWNFDHHNNGGPLHLDVMARSETVDTVEIKGEPAPSVISVDSNRETPEILESSSLATGRMPIKQAFATHDSSSSCNRTEAGLSAIKHHDDGIPMTPASCHSSVAPSLLITATLPSNPMDIPTGPRTARPIRMARKRKANDSISGLGYGSKTSSPNPALDGNKALCTELMSIETSIPSDKSANRVLEIPRSHSQQPMGGEDRTMAQTARAWLNGIEAVLKSIEYATLAERSATQSALDHLSADIDRLEKGSPDWASEKHG